MGSAIIEGGPARGGFPLGIGRGMAAAMAFSIAATLGGVSAAQEDGLFEDMPTGPLLELYADVGAVLRRRGVLTVDRAEEQLYAELLFSHVVAQVGGGAAQDLLVIGVREPEVGAGRRGDLSAMLPKGDGFAAVGVVTFRYDFRPLRGAVAPVAVVRAMADPEGRVQLDERFWRADGVDDMTARIHQAATRY